MHFEYSLTIEDLAEAARPALTRKQASHLHRGLLGWIVSVSFAVLMYCARRVQWMPGGRVRVLRSVALTYPEQNLWTTLTPSLLPVSMVIMAMLISAYRTYQRMRIARASSLPAQDLVQVKLMGLITVIPMVVSIVLAVTPQLAIPWHPSPSQALWVAFSPWIVLSLLVLIGGRLNRRVSASFNWYRTRSLKRPIRLDVTADGVETDNGLQTCRWLWGALNRYRETENLLILTTEDEASLLIPKRSAPDAGALDALYSLVQQSIANGEFQPRESRFPVLPQRVIPLAA